MEWRCEQSANGTLRWPLREMEQGDTLRVDLFEMPFERVRSTVMSRATQMQRPGCYVVRRADDGGTIVTRISAADRMPKRAPLTDYGTARSYVETAYPGVVMDNLPVHYLEHGEAKDFAAVRASPLPLMPFLVVPLVDRRIGIAMRADGFSVERVADDTTFQSWAPSKVLLT